jgi:predicted S18 family serine protease
MAFLEVMQAICLYSASNGNLDVIGGQSVKNNQEISQVLEKFSDWTMPWAYLQETLATEGLTEEDRVLIEKIWREADASAYWKEPSMQSNIAVATAELKAKFSWLGDDAIRNVVRAASYMWK